VPISLGVNSRFGTAAVRKANGLPAAADESRGAGAALTPAVAPAAVLIADAERRIVHVEGGAFDAHGLRTRGWIGLTLEQVLPAEALPSLIPRYHAAITGESQSFEYRTQDGHRTYWVQMAPVRDGDGAVTSVVAVMEDITERLRMTNRLARSEARLREAERMVGVGSWEMAVRTGDITFSAGLARLLGLNDKQRLTARSHLELVHPDDRQLVAGLGRACVTAGSVACEYRVVRADGGTRIFSLHAELVPREPGRPLYMRGAVLDVTDQRTAESERLAAEDMLRQGFDAAPIGMALSDPADGSCVRVNDAMCRLLGRPRETLLGQPMSSFSHPDDLAALRVALDQMLDGSTCTFESEHRFFRADSSLAWGMLHITPVRRPDGSVEAFYSQLVDITERKEREVRLEHDVGDAVWLGRIRDALDEDRLVLYSQPIVDLVTGQTVQNELLLRMRTDDGRIIAPAEFLPAAERYGLISEIDRWVVRQAVRTAAGGTPTEFNLSGRSISDPNIIRELATAIQDTGVNPALLVVEVTETAFVGQTEAGREFAQRVRELGCGLALDDFGTGFSSLSYLKHLPADYLKIDIDFVRELTTSETDARVIRGIVGLAREFDQTTIAEGVEDEATLIMLKELGVDQAQGYLFGRPAPSCGAFTDAASAGLTPTSQSGPAADCAPAAAGAASAGCADPIGLVRTAFEAFAARDVTAMLAFCRPDIVLRPFVTQQVTQRPEPYRGLDGVRGYLSDVAAVWDELRLTPPTFRLAQQSVIGFGRAEGQRAGGRILASIVWVVRLVEGQIASIEVFQAVGGPQMSPAQLERLEHPALAAHPAAGPSAGPAIPGRRPPTLTVARPGGAAGRGA